MAMDNPQRDIPDRQGRSSIVQRVGARRDLSADFYHALMVIPWGWLIALISLMFISLNAVFALLYCLRSGSIRNADGPSFTDAFFFSIESWSTIGYGDMTPANRYAQMLVTVESFVGMLFGALVTGIFFAKFSRSSARVLFARNAVTATVNGRKFFMFRMANERGNSIVDASVSVNLVREETTREGQKMIRMIELPLVQSRCPSFHLTFLGMHEIDETSPLYGMTRDTLMEEKARIMVDVVGLDVTVHQTLHVGHVYWPQDIRFQHRYHHVLTAHSDGTAEMNFHAFHDVEPEPETLGNTPLPAVDAD